MLKQFKILNTALHSLSYGISRNDFLIIVQVLVNSRMSVIHDCVINMHNHRCKHIKHRRLNEIFHNQHTSITKKRSFPSEFKKCQGRANEIIAFGTPVFKQPQGVRK